jgi:hypothetical protein
MLNPEAANAGSCLIILHPDFKTLDYQFQFLRENYFKKGFITVGFLFPGDSSTCFNTIQSIISKISQNVGATATTKWTPYKTMFKFEINYKNLTKIEKKHFLNSFYLLAIYQLTEEENLEVQLNFRQIRSELQFTNSVDYPKEAIKIKPSCKSFSSVSFKNF